jgi:formate/nitrite transporter FocA (FNT family)
MPAEAPEYTPKLNEQEKQEVEQRSATPAHVVHEAIRKEGTEELARPSSALAWSGLAAGLSMGFSLVGEGVLRTYLPNESWRPLIAKFGYSLGFLMVVLGRQQLFTENTLTAIIPLLARRNRETALNVSRLWAVVLISNLVGAFLFAWAISNTGAFRPEVQHSFSDLGHEAIQNGFGLALLRGVFAGWLIALMVWLLPVAETARIWIVIIVTWLVGVCGLTHIIAGSVETMFLVTSGQVSFGDYVGTYMIPTLLGNILGGVALVAALNHAQVVSGSSSQETSGD